MDYQHLSPNPHIGLQLMEERQRHVRHEVAENRSSDSHEGMSRRQDITILDPHIERDIDNNAVLARNLIET